MERKLTAENAIIKTATVEIKTLTISGKQVTLAVFRQLPNESCFDLLGEEDGEQIMIRGPIWGRVNYHPDKTCTEFANKHHIHVVWQDGAELKRSIVVAPYAAASPHLRNLHGDYCYSEADESRPGTWHVYRPDDIVFHETCAMLVAELRALHREDKEQQSYWNEELTRWFGNYQKIYAQIMQCDQLYIAV